MMSAYINGQQQQDPNASFSSHATPLQTSAVAWWKCKEICTEDRISE